MAAKTEKNLERVYNIPLRKQYLKVPRWKRTKKAVVAVKQFLQKHMKTESVKLGPKINEELWKNGIKNPPHHIKVTVIKDEKNVANAELFGYQPKVSKESGKKKKESSEKKEEIKEKTVAAETIETVTEKKEKTKKK